jgi:hypothetical protein
MAITLSRCYEETEDISLEAGPRLRRNDGPAGGGLDAHH